MGDPRRPAPEDRLTPPGRAEVTAVWLTNPAGDQPLGGDWCTVIDLPDGLTRLAVGDAMGHGAGAAVAMMRLRAATYLLAHAGLPPHAILAGLSHLAGESDSAFATCVYAVIDPAAGSADIASAGHPPPVLAPPARAARVIDLPPGLPLGLGSDEFQSTTVALPPGSILALYTDGLVESRTRPIGDGIRALTDTLSRSHGPLPATCDAIIHALGKNTDDDTTILLARTSDRPNSQRRVL